MSKQRQTNKKAQLSPDRADRLAASPGWSWDPRAEDWKEGFRHLNSFVLREGHARVAQGHREGEFRLGTWVAGQRQAHKEAGLTPEREARLERLPGWSWDARQNA